MLKQSCSRMKKVLAMLWVVLFVVSLTAATVSVARHRRGGHHLWLPRLWTPPLAYTTLLPWHYYLTVPWDGALALTSGYGPLTSAVYTPVIYSSFKAKSALTTMYLNIYKFWLTLYHFTSSWKIEYRANIFLDNVYVSVVFTDAQFLK